MSIEDVVAAANTQVTLASAKFKLQQSAISARDVADDSGIDEWSRMQPPPSVSYIPESSDSFRSTAFGSSAAGAAKIHQRTGSSSQLQRAASASASGSRPAPSPTQQRPPTVEQAKSVHVVPNQVASNGSATQGGVTRSISSGRTWGK